MTQTNKTFRNERLTYRLNIVAQEAITANDEIFLKETGCRIRDLRVLRLIDDTPGTTFAEIAKVTGFERSLTSRIIQNLLGAGLIVRENSSEDARVFLLSTTDGGKEVRQVAKRVSDRLEVILTDPLSAQELRALNEILDRLGSWVTSEEYRSALSENQPV
ncbi:MarR family winged helix-turn-helix transcriptional regulator [Defluviimonas sp. WL0024]|uniref:MarR family winged helix-turn-helix transcriptional regulator n=1 Tax=Albidovulum salinarum TaxID=2984153 RepID=A0ABT2X6Q1_9RHOB|nr:MarR family winged helix-turn-helix transcriptional regulator [Defluviimonas sp. WL0024]MCU9849009.1 MarR family winged helix-turn-helix transcriptional regulator [Defluviimonas sp. WL0024]